MRMERSHLIVIGLALALLAPGPRSARADAPPPVTLTSVRSWTAPANTRVVFDFSSPVDAVMPDSGNAVQLVIRVSAPGIVPGTNAPGVLAVRDSTVDTVFTSFDPQGAVLALHMPTGTMFRAFRLAGGDDKPFRIVVDVARPTAQVEEDRRLASVAAEKRRDRVRLVVIDPGHGGDDTGAKGPGGTLEKNVTLAVGRDLAEELNKVPGVRAMLTRDGDFFIPLRQRYRIAEKAHADLFISIHCNSSHRRGHGSGTEVYFLSLKGAEDQADQDLADVENAADLVGGVPPQAEDDVVGVLYNVRRNAALERSQLLAESLLDHVSSELRVESRGIKQAGFAVLKSVEFPSVLVETAFINNPREVRMLRDPTFQRQLGKQLASGVVAYFEKAGTPVGVAPDTLRSAAQAVRGQ